MRFVALSALLLTAFPAAAQVLDEKAAKAALFPVRGHVVQVSSKLSERDQQTVRALVPLMAEQLRQPVRYYAAIAYSPKDGLAHDSIQAAMNYHSIEAASDAAVTACNGARSKGAPPCQLAARMVPKRYQPRALTLSIDATAAFDKAYRKAKSPKAFAISNATGSWGMGSSDAAAVAACEKTGKPKDCRIVIRD
ncbi:MAG: 5-aminolevulic acid synthase [Silicimonas sp.]|nr:5-aminolevulic acid synthase [Silicimonas sp.]